MKLKDGTFECITNELDVADIVEKYCGNELADVIRKTEYSKFVDTVIEATNNLADMFYEHIWEIEPKDMTEDEIRKLYIATEKSLSLLHEVI